MNYPFQVYNKDDNSPLMIDILQKRKKPLKIDFDSDKMLAIGGIVMPKISVIIPMYNAEEYVGLAIETMLAQTFRDFELILIDDASTDRTLEVAKQFDDPRIRIIKNDKNLGGENGPGVVRNIGLDHARGEYIYFMDNDDVIMPEALEVMIGPAKKTNADVLINTKNFLADSNDFTSLGEIPNLRIQNRGKNNPVAKDLKKRVLEEYAINNSSAAPWNHFYRNKFLKKSGIRFKDIVIHDDGVFLLELLCATPNIVKLAEPFYLWRQRKTSLTFSTFDNADGFAKRVRSFLIILEWFQEILTRALQKQYGEVDYYFIDLICLNIKNRAFTRALRYGYGVDPTASWEILRRELEARYGKNTSLLRKMVHGYFIESIANRSANEENERLKLTMQQIKGEINRLITF